MGEFQIRIGAETVPEWNIRDYRFVFSYLREDVAPILPSFGANRWNWELEVSQGDFLLSP
jgi:hypothetical protein